MNPQNNENYLLSILEIVPEGKVVEKGDFLVRLDDASLQKDLLRQRISVHQSKATLVKANADVEAATLALQPRRCLAPGECTRTARAALPRRERACCPRLIAAALFGLVAKLLACGGFVLLRVTCPGPRGLAAQPSIAPGHAWAAVACLGFVGSRKLPTAPPIGLGALAQALGVARAAAEGGRAAPSRRAPVPGGPPAARHPPKTHATPA